MSSTVTRRKDVYVFSSDYQPKAGNRKKNSKGKIFYLHENFRLKQELVASKMQSLPLEDLFLGTALTRKSISMDFHEYFVRVEAREINKKSLRIF
jgi:hypothetical protein